jgi:predicted branched-subunit amino acid permease
VKDKGRAGRSGSGAGHSSAVTAGATGVAPGRRRWGPVLLSLLVFPGLGQLATGRLWRGLAFAGASVVLLAALLRRVYQETARLMPHDPDDLLDPALPLRLVAEVHRANASFFFWTTIGILVLWVASGLDAWASGAGARAAARRSGPRP